MRQFAFVNDADPDSKAFFIEAVGYIAARHKFLHYLQEHVDAKLTIRDIFDEWIVRELETLPV